MRLPSTNGVSLPYGATSPPYSSTNKHAGTDYRYLPDYHWYAPETVKITNITVSTTCGKQVDFVSLDGVRKYRGCHNAEIFVHIGETVPEGFKMARMGDSGLAQGKHLHIVMWVNGVRVDPDATIKSMIGGTMESPDYMSANIYHQALTGKNWAQSAWESAAKGKSYPVVLDMILQSQARKDYVNYIANLEKQQQFVPLGKEVYVEKD